MAYQKGFYKFDPAQQGAYHQTQNNQAQTNQQIMQQGLLLIQQGVQLTQQGIQAVQQKIHFIQQEMQLFQQNMIKPQEMQNFQKEMEYLQQEMESLQNEMHYLQQGTHFVQLDIQNIPQETINSQTVANQKATNSSPTKASHGKLEIESKIGYQFKNKGYLRCALARSIELQPERKRMVFIGSSLISFSVTEFLFNKFPESKEGDLTSIRGNLISQDTLQRFSIQLGINKFSKQSSPSGLVKTLKAIVAAIYIDGGIESANCFVKNLIQSEFTI
ncbi:ribonuclease III [Histomonas meleagridis]|uniref:ribonuclease III n=1 Tax=Histomonas meleagridis TaxID=135588 RepID=UPI00355A92C6|nr:ribonuclease III [Histomonas meleagridis]KAH0803120.1 ribonuclease III [Histomonas meleagridis]